MWHVHYLHMRGYMVRRTFYTQAKAQEFIDANALVYPLPLCTLGNDNECEQCDENNGRYEDTSNHYPSTENADGF